MQKLFKYFGPIAISFLLCGCPYESFMPIDNPGAIQIDSRLLGKWKNRSDGTVYTLSRYDDYTYKLSYADGSYLSTYYPFMSFVNNQSFLNIPHRDVFDKNSKYYLLSISIDSYGNTLTLRGINGSWYFYPQNSTELRNGIAANINSSTFYSTNPNDNLILERDSNAPPVAVQEGFTAAINNVIADYPNRFENITGKVIPELINYVYEARVNIPGSSYCRIVNTQASGLYFNADYIASYSASEEAYQQAVKQFNDLVSIFENTSFSIPLVKSKIKHTGNKQDMGDQEEQEFISSSDDERFNSMKIRIALSKNYDVKDQMNPKSWQQYYNVSIRIKR